MHLVCQQPTLPLKYSKQFDGVEVRSISIFCRVSSSFVETDLARSLHDTTFFIKEKRTFLPL
jgi:hypothetical protein